MDKTHVEHTLDPIFFSDSEILILGTMPSPKSREKMFYYAHPQNRFWKALAGALDEPVPTDTHQCVMLLKNHKIALWDVLESCDIVGASDASIRNPVPNDIASIIRYTYIHTIYTTGTTAHKLYNKLIKPVIKKEAILLPSPSPANARMSLEQLTEEYRRRLKR